MLPPARPDYAQPSGLAVIPFSSMSFAPTWSRLPRSEQCSLAGLVLVAVCTLSFLSYFATRELVVATILKSGVGLLLLAIALTGRAAYLVVRDWRRSQPRLGVSWLGSRGLLLATWLACSLVAVGAFPKGNRTLMDEVGVLNTARAIQEEKEPGTPMAIQAYSGVHKLTAGFIDKRPFLFATLVSFLHDIRGYSLENPFYCNMALAAVVLALAGMMGARLGRSAIAGVVAMVALTAIPLFCQHASGGGIDMLNLAMLLALVVLAVRHLDAPTTSTARALVGAGVLLAYSRYESLLHCGICVGALLIVAVRQRRLFLDWSTPVLAACLFPLAGIHFLNFTSTSDVVFQLEEKGLRDAFSLAYVVPNLGHALSFFFDTGHFLANSPVVFVMGGVAFVAVIVTQAKHWCRIRDDSGALMFWIMAASVLIAFFLLMAYSWGELDQVVGSRLSLPLYLVFALSLAYVCREFSRWPKVPVAMVGVLAVGGYWSVSPVAAKNYEHKQYALGRALELYDEFVARQPDPYYAVLNSATLFWVSRDVYAIGPSSLKGNPEYLLNLLKSKEYRRVYLIQLFKRETSSQSLRCEANDEVGFPLDLTLVSEDMATSYRMVKIWQLNPACVQMLERVVAERASKGGGAAGSPAAAGATEVPAAH